MGAAGSECVALRQCLPALRCQPAAVWRTLRRCPPVLCMASTGCIHQQQLVPRVAAALPDTGVVCLLCPLPLLLTGTQGVVSTACVRVDGGPARAVAAAQQQRRLFESASFVLAASGGQHETRVDALASLITFGGGLMLKLQPGQSRAVCDRGLPRMLSEDEFRRRQERAPKGTPRGTGWQRFLVLCGDIRRKQVLEMSQHWDTQHVVNAVYVLDCIVAFEMLSLEQYRLM